MSQSKELTGNVYKYTLPNKGLNKVEWPGKGHIMHVGLHDGKLCIWVLVNPDNPYINHNIVVVGTGWKIAHAERLKPIGTVITHQGYVWHVFKEKQ